MPRHEVYRTQALVAGAQVPPAQEAQTPELPIPDPPKKRARAKGTKKRKTGHV